MSIYVEIRIRGPIDEIWRRTQTPGLHELWDLRFTSIDYLPRADEDAPQTFRYATRVGVEIEGWGETAGRHVADGSRTSALRFGSDDPRSLIRAGSGYWKYEPTDDGVRFLTGYDYDVRWGRFGRLVDALLFQRLMGWATAWSFDRLRLWIETGAEPWRLLRQAQIHALATGAASFTWIWHGLVPKLAGPHPEEIAMLLEVGVPAGRAPLVVMGVGILEVALGLSVLVLSRRPWPWVATITLMAAATIGVLLSAPARALAPFTPVTLNLLLAGIAAVGLLTLRDLPSAGRCLRRPPPREPGTAP